MENISVILILLASYTIMLLLIVGVNKIRPGIASYDKVQPNNLTLLNCLHIISIILMLLPVWAINPLPIFLLPFPDKISIEQAISFLIVFGVIGFFPWKKFSNKIYEDENSSSPVIHIIFYAFLRTVFLIVYEWFFRGLLLITISAWLGISWGIIINILLYTFIHSHKRKKEMIGCIPLGLLFCVFTIWWQSIWPAIIFHLQIAAINEWPPLQKFIPQQKQTAL